MRLKRDGRSLNGIRERFGCGCRAEDDEQDEGKIPPQFMKGKKGKKDDDADDDEEEGKKKGMYAGKKKGMYAGKSEDEQDESSSAEINLVGCTVDESTRRLEKYLDTAFLEGLPRVRVIHGKGTGALRKGVHKFLTGHPLVEGFHLAEMSEGGSGATVVTLREQ